MHDLLTTPSTDGPNWATILAAASTTLGLIAAFLAAAYAKRQYERGTERELKEQASKVAFWAEVEQDRMRVLYVNTSGLPVWDVLVRPLGAGVGEVDCHEEFTLGPSDAAKYVGPPWGWVPGAASGLLETQQQAMRDLSKSISQIAGVAHMTGGWKRLQPSEPHRTHRLEHARLDVQFTDAAGVRWHRDAAGHLAPTNVPARRTTSDLVRSLGTWIADGLRSGSHDSSKS